MVSCCVPRCFNYKKKKSNITFHAFPLNPFLRKKWLCAIGRLDWEPQSYSRVCSAHFTAEHFVQVGNKITIKHDACPINNSMPAQKLLLNEICRICLATDIKMYSIKTGELRLYVDSIPEFSENLETVGMPQVVCYECAVQLKKCWLLIKKIITSKKILLDMSTQNVQMDKDLLNLYREYLELMSPLTYHEKTPMRLCIYKYDDEKNISVLTNKEFIRVDEDKEDEVRYIPNIWRHVPDTLESNEVRKPDSDNELNTDDHQLQEEEVYVMEINDNMNDDFANLDPIDISTEPIIELPVVEPKKDIKSEVIEVPEELIRSLVRKKRNRKTPKKPKRKPGEKKSTRINGLTLEERTLLKYFDIVQIDTLQDQIDDWKKMVGSLLERREDAKKCEVCSKYFISADAYARHVVRHDPKRGNIECPVCKLRYKYERDLRSHFNQTHNKRFHCRSCAKVYRSVTAAQTHQQFHSGRQYKCKHCSFSTMGKSTLFLHIQNNHSRLACEICGRSCIGLFQHRALAHAGYTPPEGGETYPCEDCKLNFNSENARRVHLLTSKQHKDVSRKDPTLQTTCKECGSSFLTYHELILHNKTEHRIFKTSYQQKSTVVTKIHPRKSTVEKCSIQCNYCHAWIESRFELYCHVRRQHYEYLSEYKQSIQKKKVAVVCEKCGKGFVCEALLRLHKLRHAAPRERCEQCGRMFFERRALAAHEAAAHRGQRRYCCDVCGRTFAFKGNLERHMRIHTGVKPYECSLCGKKFRQICGRTLHMNTVHLGMPHPPRKRRKAKARNIPAKDNDTSDKND